MATIPLFRYGVQVAETLVDDDIADLLGQWNWYARTVRKKQRQWTYAIRQTGGGLVPFTMQNFLMRPDPGFVVDHIDRDPLNNRFDNLRIVTLAQNNQNLSPRQGSTSPYRGVSYVSGSGRWLAQATVNGRAWQQSFDTEIEAAEAAREYRRLHMPFSVD